MLKPMIIKAMTIPWAVAGTGLVWAVENRADAFTEPWQVFLMSAAVCICLLAVFIGFMVADEVKKEEMDLIRRMGTKKERSGRASKRALDYN